MSPAVRDAVTTDIGAGAVVAVGPSRAGHEPAVDVNAGRGATSELGGHEPVDIGKSPRANVDAPVVVGGATANRCTGRCSAGTVAAPKPCRNGGAVGVVAEAVKGAPSVSSCTGVGASPNALPLLLNVLVPPVPLVPSVGAVAIAGAGSRPIAGAASRS